VSRLYTPDRWTVIYYPEQDVHTILGGWWGGYLHGDSWRRSTAVQRAEEDEQYYYFHNMSGSIYKCAKGSYGTTGMTAGLLAEVKDLGVEDVGEDSLPALIEFYKHDKEEENEDGH